MSDLELNPDLERIVAASVQRQAEIDRDQAGPKALQSWTNHKGIRIESRWGLVRELETMRQVIDAMPELLARRIASIWCDSKCGSNFVVRISSSRFAPDLPRVCDESIHTINGGHNGIAIEDLETGERLAEIDPDWNEV